ncbi:MAG: hypothetical protein ACETWR_25140 [Anaerolineae bacterium]
MKRIHWFEFEDQTWFPKTFRTLLTEHLQFRMTVFRSYEPLIPLIKKVMQHMNTTQIIDLCSGAAGPWVQIQAQLMKEHWPASVILTDKYPNIESFERIVKLSNHQVGYIANSIDATDVPAHLKGIRAIFNGFHHFQPDSARAILQSAVDQGTAICIFEITERRLWNLLITLIYTPLSIFLATLFMKSITLGRILWTYIVPVVPFISAWDGIVSHLRTYSPDELETLVNSVKSEGYVWEIGQVTPPITKIIPITYLLGYPENPG